ncbi:Tho complex subunit 7-domain-containing protein [Haematococcus lacustris]
MAASAKFLALSAAEEEAVIRFRCLTQASVARGEPPFKKLAKRLLTFCEDCERGTPEAVNADFDLLLKEISSIELQTAKQKAAVQANAIEQQKYAQAHQDLQAQIEQAKVDIETKKAELEAARIVRQHNEEYEVLRHLLAQLPPRAATQHEIDRVNRNIERITTEGKKIASIMQKRRQQFALLFHVIEELQRATEEPDEQSDTAAAAGGPEEAGGEVTAQLMEVDA